LFREEVFQNRSSAERPPLSALIVRIAANSIPLQMFPIKTSVIVAHLTAWVLFITLPVLFVSNRGGVNTFWSILFSPDTLLFFTTYLFIFYLHSWILLPLLYLKKRYGWYALSILILLIGIWLIRPFDRLVNGEQPRAADHRPPPGPPPSRPRTGEFRDGRQMDKKGPGQGFRVDIVSVFLLVTILAMSLAIQTRHQWRLTEQRAMQAEADKANAELSFLKAQINPHFLFNTLNNIYTLAATNSPQTAESIMKLSNIMRYVTDDLREEFVPLTDELSFINDYIDLQRLRLGSKVEIVFTVSGQPGERKIAPLILMTFIENIFKYGISKQESVRVDIRLRIDAQRIEFFCENPLYPLKKQAEARPSGIGIDNTKQRLEHLYPGRHRLAIGQDHGKYTVELELYQNV
jgi:two-component system LytT family sensor kinase